MALPCEPGNYKERCTLCSVALAKKRCAMPRDPDCPSKLPPALPCSHSQPSPSTRVRERERERASEARAPSRTRAEKQLPLLPRWPAPPSPPQDPQSRRRFLAGATAIAARRAADSAAGSFSPCCCCEVLRLDSSSVGWRRAAEPRPRRAHRERVSYFTVSNHSPFRSADFGLPFVGLGDLFGARTRCSGSGKFGSFRSVRW